MFSSRFIRPAVARATPRPIITNTPSIASRFFTTSSPRMTVHIFETWSEDEKFKDKIYFAKFDVDHLPDLAQELGIRAMPTFIIFKDGEKVGDVVGANPAAILAALNKQVD
ncbi:unnamed protein product [Sordaria macrospora k-hell]|uniref:WGS project CABT00000000 data, contig 2.21 n=1 Tax=Sordaria macrospora (strain ATCC MYA-333 / DSM 997 / K(L3346) / K-hell) TaxID=771870 RepID=F7W251_SORMK|nr:uncharacterized protein SMAC_04684 [Sordaria macrospora k-hell]CCC11701.1 unnamed protein product [Sordaria macrospora k-hell]